MSTNIVPADLAARINEAHALATRHASDAVESARRAGELLLEAKAAVKHGEFSAWLAANVTVSDRTARGYMRLARELPTLPEAKRQRVAEMPLRDASKELWKMKREEREKQRIARGGGQHSGLDRTVQSSGEQPAEVVELWTSARQVLTSAACIAPLNDVQRLTIRDDFKAFVPLLPGDWAQLPEGALREAEAARAQFLAEARERAAELIRWVDEQRAALARMVQTAAESASDYPEIYVGTKRGGAIEADIRFLGVPTWELPPDQDDDEQPDTFVAEYLEAHPGATLNDALNAAAEDLSALASRFSFKRHGDEGEWKNADGTPLGSDSALDQAWDEATPRARERFMREVRAEAAE